MADYAVSTAFKSKDGITTAFKKMAAAAGKYGRTTDRAFDRANRSGLTFKKTLGAILSAQVIGRGVGLLQQGIRSVSEEFVTFDDAITQAGAKFPVVAKRGSAAFEKLTATARQVGATTKFSATEAAEGLDFLAMAGFNAEQAMAALPQVTNLAVVANADLARATDIASDALGSFGMQTKDTAQLTQNLARINDVFAKTVTSANTDIEMLFEAMKDGGPVITAAGQSVETFAALAGKMADAGIKGTKAGTTLKNMFLNLQSPVPKAGALMRKLKINAIDPTTGSMRDIIDILGDFNEKTKNMGKAQKAAALDTIFGKRAIAGVSVLLGQGSDALREYRETLIGARGASKDMADTIGQSLGNRLKALRSAAIEAGFRFIDAFEDKIPGAIDSAIEAVRKFDVGQVIEDIKSIVRVLRVMKDVIAPLTPAIVTMTGAWVAYRGIMTGIMAIQSVQKFLAMSAALKGAAASQSLLNAAMIANPIGMVVTAVGLLVTAGVMLYKQWDNIKLLFNLLWEDLKSIWRWFKQTKFGQIIGGVVEAAGKFLPKRGPVKQTEPSATDIAFERNVARKAAKEKFRQQVLAERGLLKKPAVPEIGRTAQQGIVTRGLGPAGRRAPEAARTPPNREDVAAQNINFQGKLTVAGAPPGSTLEGTTRGAPPVKTEMAGANL